MEPGVPLSVALLNEIRTGPAKSADAIVPCIPFDAEADAARCEWLRAAHVGKSPAWVVHLGGGRGEAGCWNDLPGFLCLDDAFELHESLDGIRERRLARAHRACDERAEHRDLGAALSLAHGWEDLSAFARSDAGALAAA